MTKNNDGRKHWRFGRIYEKERTFREGIQISMRKV